MELYVLVITIKHLKLQNKIILSQIHNYKVYLWFYCNSNHVGLGLKYQVLAFRWDFCFLAQCGVSICALSLSV